MKKKDKYIIIIIVFVTAIISIVSVFKISKIILDIKGNPKDIVYTSSNLDKTNYKVYLKENDFIDKNILDQTQSYITSLVDNIKIKYNYLFKTNKKIDLNYNYHIEANIIGLFNPGTINPVLDLKYNIKNISENRKVNESNQINEDIIIDLDYYNSIIEKFISELNIPIDASLNIKLIINYIGKINDKSLSKEHFINVSIPLGVKAFDIALSHNFEDEEKVYLNNIPDKEKSFVNIIIYILIVSLSLGIGIYLIKKIIYKYKSKFITTIDKILKEYNERIIEVTNFVKYQKWETVDIKNFEELINLSNESFEPIFYFKRKFNHNTEAWFCILRDKVLYRFILYKKEKE